MRKEEPYFYASTVLKEEPVVATAAEEFQPEFSPDGKEVAYLENRVVAEGRQPGLQGRRGRSCRPSINYSYADGDQAYQWSPDGKWFLVQFAYRPPVHAAGRAGLERRQGPGRQPDQERLRQHSAPAGAWTAR
ncbi:MAG: hypothetical protein MZU91_11130 [Desulfosudis oleivorans]|nr:hypothetical protein [Desulfosudis oleivorans]